MTLLDHLTEKGYNVYIEDDKELAITVNLGGVKHLWIEHSDEDETIELYDSSCMIQILTIDYDDPKLVDKIEALVHLRSEESYDNE